ncbi:interferon-induced protein with tetratricopeptide repeats 1-like [Phyllopteryx taeniolatus]|uniref:interferon-induced protein with tetratricopeptide repeats 1-like n=1 Tax=Phyllopteryx taeniolatus TaxID=161469 RepID=UPI002AD27037|nr:interferon-induced protein with tetratricopeptide repeats 1-like [Phyllopteryx taeniolatus]
MMSGARSQTTLKADLESLQCHFTWNLNPPRSKLFLLRDKLEDIGTVEGYSWLGHIYNLQGYIHYQLGSTKDALRFFGRAAEALRQMRNTVSEEGPWLVVNYGNLAWLHYHMGKLAESQTYLSKVDNLLIEYPCPCHEELHSEICAEKAWALMKFGEDNTLLAVHYFQRAIRMQPDIIEWHTSHVLALVSTSKLYKTRLDANTFEKMKIARKHDPKNLYLSTIYLAACAARGRRIEGEACRLAKNILKKPVSSYSGIKPLLKLYRVYLSIDEALDLAEEALERHPGERYLKRCAAICYKKKILSHGDIPQEQNVIDKAISLYTEVIALYHQSSLKRKITLATIYVKSTHNRAKAGEMFEELLHQSGQEPGDRQMLYNYYAKYLQLTQKQSYKSIEYYMRAAAIQHPSVYRVNSIQILKKIRERNRNRMCREIEDFLDNLPD